MAIIKLQPYIIDSTKDFTFNNVTATANLVSLNANLGNLATANFFTGNGSSLTGVAAVTAATVTTGAQPNITSIGTLVDLAVSGNASVSGNLTVSGTVEYTNVTNLYIKDPIIEQGGAANGAALSSNDNKDRGQLLHYFTTAPVDAFMGWDSSNAEFAFGSNVSVSSEVMTFNSFGNVRADYFLGNASQLTGAIANATYSASAGSATTAGTVTTDAQPNITSIGTLSNLTSNGTVNFTNASNVSLGSIGNIKISGGTSGYVLQTDGTGNLSWTAQSGGGGGGTPGGVDTQVQFNSSGTFAGDANLTYTTSTDTLNVTNLSVEATGNVSGGNLVSANYFTGTLTTAAQPNITSIGTLSNLIGNGTVNFTSASNVSLGAVGNVKLSGGSSGQYLKTDGTGNLSWATVTSSGGGGGGGGGSFTLDTFIGDGVQTDFVLSVTPDSINNLIINYNGAIQLQESYLLTGGTVTFDEAPANGSKIDVMILPGAAAPVIDTSSLLSPFLLMGA